MGLSKNSKFFNKYVLTLSLLESNQTRSKFKRTDFAEQLALNDNFCHAADRGAKEGLALQLMR
jgi:hypothetical protein